MHGRDECQRRDRGGEHDAETGGRVPAQQMTAPPPARGHRAEEGVRDAVGVESVEPLELKGKSERVAAFRLVSAIGLDGYVRRHDSAIVGRDEELAAIDQALREVTETQSARMITHVGDAGIGKARRAQAVIARAGATPAWATGAKAKAGSSSASLRRELASSASSIRVAGRMRVVIDFAGASEIVCSAARPVV